MFLDAPRCSKMFLDVPRWSSAAFISDGTFNHLVIACIKHVDQNYVKIMYEEHNRRDGRGWQKVSAATPHPATNYLKHIELLGRRF